MHTDSTHVGNKRKDEDATCGQWIHGKLENIENIRENMEAPGMESWQIGQATWTEFPCQGCNWLIDH
jgi:hypothetical protein